MYQATGMERTVLLVMIVLFVMVFAAIFVPFVLGQWNSITETINSSLMASNLITEGGVE